MKSLFFFLLSIKLSFAGFVASDYFGTESYDEKKSLVVLENPKQNHSKQKYILVKVKNVDVKRIMPHSRIRVATWKSGENYAKEDVAPYRASSISANLAFIKENGFLTFKLGIDSDVSELSIFIHFDLHNKSRVERNMFGIPKDPYMFSKKESKSGCPGIAREGLSQPKFEHTLVEIKNNGQVIEMCF